MATKKDYVAIAEIINATRLTDEDVTRVTDAYSACIIVTFVEIGNKLADYFTTDNPRFDRSRFMRACGLTE